MLEPVVVAAAVVVGGGEEVCLLVCLHVVVTDIGGRGRWSLIHVLFVFVRVGCEVDEARWGMTWSNLGP